MFKFSALAILLSMSFSSFAAKDPVVATVNGVKIKKSELELNYRQNLLVVSNKQVTKQKVLSDMINRVLGIQKAKSKRLERDPVVKGKMEDVLFNAQVSKDLEPLFKKIVVKDRDIETYYKNNPEYRTAHILFRLPVQPKQEDVEAAQKQAFKVYDVLRTDASKFPELANKYSQISTAPNGGDVGFQPAMNLAPEYFAAINGKKDGYVTPPVRTQFGYHIVKVLSKRDYKEVNMDVYRKIVYDIKRDKIIINYFKNLQSKAKIKINKDLL